MPTSSQKSCTQPESNFFGCWMMRRNQSRLYEELKVKKVKAAGFDVNWLCHEKADKWDAFIVESSKAEFPPLCEASGPTGLPARFVSPQSIGSTRLSNLRSLFRVQLTTLSTIFLCYTTVWELVGKLVHHWIINARQIRGVATKQPAFMVKADKRRRAVKPAEPMAILNKTPWLNFAWVVKTRLAYHPTLASFQPWPKPWNTTLRYGGSVLGGTGNAWISTLVMHSMDCYWQ